MFISQPPCGNACVIGTDQQPVSDLPTNPGSSSAHAVSVQQDQLGNQFEPNKHGDENETLVGEGSAGAGRPDASTKAGQLGRQSRTSATQHSRPTQQQQKQPGKANQQEQQLNITTLMDEGVGGLCRKPGRGDTTLSMSCSDKLARWTLLGVQVCLCVACSHGAASQSVAVALQTVLACNAHCKPLCAGDPVFRI